jgi:uncharacterized protein YoxC
MYAQQNIVEFMGQIKVQNYEHLAIIQQISNKIIRQNMEIECLLSKITNAGDNVFDLSSLVCEPETEVNDIEEQDTQKQPGIVSTFESICRSGLLSYGGYSDESSIDDISAVTEFTDSSVSSISLEPEPIQQLPEPIQQLPEPIQQLPELIQQLSEPIQQLSEPIQQLSEPIQQLSEPIITSTKQHRTNLQRCSQWKSIRVNFPMYHTYKKQTALYFKNEKGGITMHQSWTGEQVNIEYKSMNQAIYDMRKTIGRKSDNNVSAWKNMKTNIFNKQMSMEEFVEKYQTNNLVSC